MDFVTAIVLGFVKAVTESVPISSTGHLIMVREFLALSELETMAFSAVFNLTLAFSIIFYFRQEIWILIQALIRKLGRLPTNEKDLTLLYTLAAGTLPGVFFGLIFENFMSNLESARYVAGVLFCSAIFYMYAEWKHYLNPQQSVLTIRKGFLIGIFQVLAVIPGFSRLGVTLAGGMLLGLSRLESARFSFLLLIPITFGIGLKKILELLTREETITWWPLIVGGAVSFVVTLAAIHFFLIFIRRHTLWPFIWYNLILSFLVGYFALFM